ncbi:hypothetical protein JIR23_20180 [Bradyrhizobium diazoefficiens]|nr:hypothetical protein [Bradyrhizobium diazoefficiens]QQN61928.1 hypothetical protein JIR23_20180 [Bradyrhizobium diazoefficiens]
MNWAWASLLDQIWPSPAFPMWMTLAAAGFFGLILLITLVNAEKSVANGALTVITLLSIGIAVAATMRIYGPMGHEASEARTQATVTATLPALACLDDLAGDAVAIGCEKALFGAPDAAAAAVAYTAARIDRLTALGDAAAAKNLTLNTKVLRKALERDRYGLVAQVLVARDGCTRFDCAAFRSLTDQQQIAANMDSHLYDQLVARYAPTWNAPAAAPGALAALPPTMPTGKPTSAEFPSASSTPPVSIMNPEPPTATTRQPPATNAASAPASRAAQATTPAAPAAKKPPAPKTARAPAGAPVPLAPPPAPAPAAADNN